MNTLAKLKPKRLIAAASLVGMTLALPNAAHANAPGGNINGCVEWSQDWGCTTYLSCTVYTHLWVCTWSSFGIAYHVESGTF